MIRHDQVIVHCSTTLEAIEVARGMQEPASIISRSERCIVASSEVVDLAEKSRFLLSQIFPDKKMATLKDGLFHLRTNYKFVWQRHEKLLPQLNAADSLRMHPAKPFRIMVQDGVSRNKDSHHWPIIPTIHDRRGWRPTTFGHLSSAQILSRKQEISNLTNMCSGNQVWSI